MADPAKDPQQLMISCQGLVRSLAWSIHQKLPSHVDLDDLVGYGQIGLGEAARDFDPSRGGQFTTFAHYRIRGAILDGLSKMRWFKQTDFHRGRYERLANEVLNVEGAAAEPESQLDDDVRWLKNVSGALAMVYLFSHQAGEEDPAEAAVEDRSSVSPLAATLNKEMEQKLHELIDALPAEAGSLIRSAYFEDLTLKEAGERLGVSKAWASRLHAKALSQLAKSLQSADLGD